jgi:HAD superfamily hydrolase (TIGR01509 family)
LNCRFIKKELPVVKACIFDMDGVLCDSESVIAVAACRLFRERGVTVTPKDFEPFIGTGEERYLLGVAEKFGVVLTMPDDKETLYRLYADIARRDLKPIGGVVEFLRNAASEGILLAVATSADEFKMDVNLAAIGVEKELFAARVTGDQVVHKKPAPDIFLKAAQLLGFSPDDCIVFEDAVNGVQAAKAAGMRCVGITSSFSAEVLLANGADWTAPDFNSLPPELIKIAAL